MKNRVMTGMAIAGVTLFAPCLLMNPRTADAQTKPNAPDNSVERQVIALDIEDTDLYAAFSLLFKQAKVNYTLDASLKGTSITAHIKLPFRQAIATLIKTSGLPIALLVENGVYSIVPDKPEPKGLEPEPQTIEIVDDATPPARQLARVPLHFLNSIDFAALFGTKCYLYTNSLANHGNNPFAPAVFGGAANGVPAAGGASGTSGAGGANTNGGSGQASGYLPAGVLPDEMLAFDMDTSALLVLFH